MNQDKLKSKTRHGLLWSLVERFSTQGIQFVFGIILARILTPNDYGIIAMPLIFLSIAQCFIDSGFSTALVRKNELKEEDLSTAFIFSIAIGLFCYAILFISSPLIASFYDTPLLTDLLKVTALAILFNPLSSVQQAILTRELNFKKQAKISVTGALISGVVGLYMAYNGYGVWALVFQQVAGYLIRTILFWITVKWRPLFIWSHQSFKYLWGFGNKVLVQSLISNIFDNLYPLIIGKVYSSKDLGNYTRAQQFTQLPSVNITGVLFRVSLPIMSSIQNDIERLRNVFSKMIRVSAFCIFPTMLGLAAVADPLVRVILTDKWEGCIILIQLMSFNLMWYPIHALNLTILTAKGRSDLTLKLEIIKKTIFVIVLLLTVKLGIEWMVGATIGSSIISLFINIFYTKKILGFGLKEQLHDLIPIFITSLVMWGTVLTAISFINNDLYQLFFGCLIGVIVYGTLAFIFHKNEIKDLLDLVKATN